jgi:predicted Zn-dependent protease
MNPRATQRRRAVATVLLHLVLALPRLGAHGPVHEEVLRLTAELTRLPDNPALVAQRCDVQRAHGLWDEAERDLARLERLRPTDPDHDLRRGMIHAGQGRAAEAVAALDRWLTLHPADVETRAVLARALERSGDPARGAREYSEVIRQGAAPRMEWYLARAGCEAAAGAAATKVLEGLEDGIRRIGSLPELERRAAQVEAEAGWVEAAAARLGRMALASPRPARWWLEQGDAWRAGGHATEARASYQRARAAMEALPPRLRRTVEATETDAAVAARLNPGPRTATPIP